MNNTLLNTLEKITSLYLAYTQNQISFDELVYKLNNGKMLHYLYKLVESIIKLN